MFYFNSLYCTLQEISPDTSRCIVGWYMGKQLISQAIQIPLCVTVVTIS